MVEVAAAVKRERQERSSRGGGRRGGVSAARVGSPQHPSRWTAAEPPANDASIVLLDLGSTTSFARLDWQTLVSIYLALCLQIGCGRNCELCQTMCQL
eukprot:COSAG01_NODE_2222_length_8137_cov_49.268972_9_plen_98_part_00